MGERVMNNERYRKRKKRFHGHELMSLVVAMSTTDGLVIVADRRIVYNRLTGFFADDATKIRRIDENTALAFVGNEGRTSVIVETVVIPRLKGRNSLLDISLIKAIAEGIQEYRGIFQIVEESADLDIGIMICSLEESPLILTFESPEFVPQLHCDYWLCGTTFWARDIIQHNWDKTKDSKEGAILLGLKALKDTMKHSIWVGGIPQVVEITSDGYKEIENARIRELWEEELAKD